jgi:hypothetical protein
LVGGHGGMFGGIEGIARAGYNYSYQVRRHCWGRPVWNTVCECYCYWDDDADCYYYYCAPDQCFYPLAYCPYGRYDYREP